MVGVGDLRLVRLEEAQLPGALPALEARGMPAFAVEQRKGSAFIETAEERAQETTL